MTNEQGPPFRKLNQANKMKKHDWPTPDITKSVPPDPLQVLSALTRDGNDIAQHQSPYGPVYVVNHPDYVKHVLRSKSYVKGKLVRLVVGDGLLASEGPYWRDQRRTMQPAFHNHCIQALGPIMVEETTKILRKWQSILPSVRSIDVATDMKRLAIIIMGKALFNADLSTCVDAIKEAATTINEDLGNIIQSSFGWPATIDPSRNQRVQTALTTLDRIVYTIICDHRRKKGHRRDLLTMLLEARNKETGEGLSDKQLRDEVVSFFLAGQETTANLIGWVWYLLAQHPKVESRLHSELDTILGRRTPTVGDLPELPYTRMVIQETLRLYPALWVLAPRHALARDEIGGCRIPKNSQVFISPYTLHRHPDFWEDPERFDPERFLPDRSADRHSHAYLPFADGKHRCIGEYFAMVEAQLIISTIAQKFSLRLVPGFSAEAGLLVSLHQHELQMTLEPRD